MTKERILYIHAYTDKREYALNQAYWHNKIAQCFHEDHAMQYKYVNIRNEQLQEGFPICVLYAEEKHKGVYVYQYPADSYQEQYAFSRYITAWIKQYENNDEIFVIYLLNTPNNTKTTQHLISLFLKGDKEGLQQEISKIYDQHTQN